jgi:molybdopterin synthase catalytic subunit
MFARARDLTGADFVSVELPEGATVGDLKRVLAEQRPALAALLARSALAVGAELAGDDLVLREGDEIALLPPVSGG